MEETMTERLKAFTSDKERIYYSRAPKLEMSTLVKRFMVSGRFYKTHT